MTTDELLDALRYQSEGTGLNFKMSQYRFVDASDYEKSELLKDILAIANAWRQGSGHIIPGFKDASPHPPEIIGITEHLDDASLQQFVQSKVKPKLNFHYEERIYKGKSIGIITIPEQTRPFYLIRAFGRSKSNVVYVRRGSSTDEAEPPEIAEMVHIDVGRGTARVELSILASTGDKLPDTVARRFFRLEQLPDYQSPPERLPYGLGPVSFERENREYWRQAAEYIKTNLSLIGLQFELANRSEFALSNVKLEISVSADDGQEVTLMAGADLPDEPQSKWHPASGIRGFAEIISRQKRFIIDGLGLTPICHVRFGMVLPGETARAIDFLAVLPSAPCRLQLSMRILAAELTVRSYMSVVFK